MNTRQSRWLMVVVSSGLLTWLLLRRRRAFLRPRPGIVEDHIVLPMGDPVRDSLPSKQVSPEDSQEHITRKVGRNRNISVDGKLYGPLEPELVGRQVQVEERAGRLIVFSGADKVGSFERQDQST